VLDKEAGIDYILARIGIQLTRNVNCLNRTFTNAAIQRIDVVISRCAAINETQRPVRCSQFIRANGIEDYRKTAFRCAIESGNRGNQRRRN